jgi:hypothetical protein
MKPRRRKVPAKLALAVITSVIAILSADFMLRIFGNELLYYRPHEMFIERRPELPLVSRYKRGVEYSGETYGDLAAMIGDERLREKRPIVFKTDAFGFRNSPEARDRKAYDLIVLGDSFGVGNGTTQDLTWVALLQGRYGIETYNLSIPGSPWQSYVHLGTEIKRLPVHPRSVVLLAIFSGNDLDEYYYPRDAAISDLPWSSPTEKFRVRASTFARRSPIRQLVSRLSRGNQSADQVLIREFVDGRKILFFQPHVTRKNRTEAMIREHANYEKLLYTIRGINRIAGEHKLPVAILLIPSKEEVYEWVLERTGAWSTDTRPSGLAAALDSFCRENNLSFLDLKPLLVEAAEKAFKESGELVYWTDDTHWNVKGHGIVADIVHRTIFPSSPTAPNKAMHTDSGSAVVRR